MGSKPINKLWNNWEYDGTDPTTEITKATAREIFLNVPHSIKRMKFDAIKALCFDTLWIHHKSWPNYKYHKAMSYYFINSANYIIHSENFKNSDDDEIDKYWEDNKLFMSVVTRINHLTKKEISKFLEKMKRLHDAPTAETNTTKNPIVIMDSVLSSLT